MFDNKNDYILKTELIEGITRFCVSFINGENILQNIEVSEAVYTTLEDSQRQDNSFARWGRRRLEQLDLQDEELYNRALHKPQSIEDTVLDALYTELFAQAVDELSEVQKRRFILHHDVGLTSEKIAVIEGCTDRAVRYSIALAKEAIKQNLKNF
ncbi:MAG: hypothetical protein FWE06_00190 [Oscillospiraceae bacterium]|nr:hypothetical protein [Oscillospiraceae bacterium]